MGAWKSRETLAYPPFQSLLPVQCSHGVALMQATWHSSSTGVGGIFVLPPAQCRYFMFMVGSGCSWQKEKGIPPLAFYHCPAAPCLTKACWLSIIHPLHLFSYTQGKLGCQIKVAVDQRGDTVLMEWKIFSDFFPTPTPFLVLTTL